MLSTVCTQGQTLWKKHELHFGFKLNPTFGYLQIQHPSPLQSDGLKLGFTFGGTADYIVSRHLAVTAGLEVSTINGGTIQTLHAPASSSQVSVVQVNKLTYQVRYLELPVAVKLRSNTIGEASLLYIKLGLDPALKLTEGASQITSLNGISTIRRNSNEGKLFSLFRASLLAGAGYDYRFSHNLTFTSGLLLNQGFTNISSGTHQGMLNSYLAIEFGLYF